jgi:DNA-binding PucR family transcriptional regulator
MVQREIGPLLGDAPTLRTLRHTALVYLAKRMSADAAATALFVHKNTVRYRVSRIEELLGHPLGERTSHVELALRYADLFDPPPDN